GRGWKRPIIAPASPLPHVPHNANDLGGFGLTEQGHLGSNGIDAAWDVTIHEGFVHDGHTRRVSIVALIENAPAQQGKFERAEVIGSHVGFIYQPAITRDLMSGDAPDIRIQRVAVREIERDCRGLYAGDRADSIKRFAEQA